MFKLLIVDDEAVIREGLRAYAESLWSEELEWIHSADSGEQAWKSIQEEGIPDLMITDIRMPHGNGIELLRKIRQEELGVKAIVLSGYNDFEYVRDMALLGIENYLLKPVNDEELISTVNSTFQKIKKEKKFRITAQLNADLIRENIINRWIYGTIWESELMDRAEFLGINLEAAQYYPCSLQILGRKEETNVKLLDEIYEICKKILNSCPGCYFSRSYSGDILAIFGVEDEGSEVMERTLDQCLGEVYNKTGQKAYILLGDGVEDYWKVAESFQQAITNGVHIDRVQINHRAEIENTSVSPFSLRVAEYVLEHYHEDLSLKTLAEHFRGNAAYIGQMFKKDMEKSFSEYLKDVRMEKAKNYLVNSSFTAKEIARRVGFSSTTYFCTVFKNATGLSPDLYRKEFGKK